MVEPDAAPAGVVSHPRFREAPGRRPLQLRGAAFNGWTRRGRRAAKAAWMRVSAPGSTVPVDRKAAGGAPCGERACRRARQRRKALDRWLRRTALHSLAMGGTRKTGLPGASTKNTGGGALAKA